MKQIKFPENLMKSIKKRIYMEKLKLYESVKYFKKCC